MVELEILSTNKNSTLDYLNQSNQASSTKFTGNLLLFTVTYHHSQFLAATLDFTSFFTLVFLEGPHLFHSLAVLV